MTYKKWTRNRSKNHAKTRNRKSGKSGGFRSHFRSKRHRKKLRKTRRGNKGFRNRFAKGLLEVKPTIHELVNNKEKFNKLVGNVVTKYLNVSSNYDEAFKLRNINKILAKQNIERVLIRQWGCCGRKAENCENVWKGGASSEWVVAPGDSGFLRKSMMDKKNAKEVIRRALRKKAENRVRADRENKAKVVVTSTRPAKIDEADIAKAIFELVEFNQGSELLGFGVKNRWAKLIITALHLNTEKEVHDMCMTTNSTNIEKGWNKLQFEVWDAWTKLYL